MIPDWASIVSQIGFPVAIALLVLLRFDKTQDAMKDLLVETVTLLRLLTRDIDTRSSSGKR